MIRFSFDWKPALLVTGWLVVLFSAPFARAEDWVTTDGKTYQNVSVVKVEDDAVTILHKYGGALVPLEKLSPDLQRRFHYDPVKAKIAAQVRARIEAEDAKALEAEKEKLEAAKAQQQINDAKAQEKAQKQVEQQQQQ